MDTIKLLESQRNDLLQQLSEIGELRPGNLSAFHRKCYRPNCHCAKPGDPGHLGWQLTRKDEHQKTIRHNIPKHALETTRKQVEEYSCLKTLVGQFAEINDQLCQARLRAGQAEKKRCIKPLARIASRRTCTGSGAGSDYAFSVALWPCKY